MEALFEKMRHLSAPLKGIIQAAAEIKFCSLREMSPEGLHSALRAKVEGTWLLHKFSSGLRLDFFVLFSSTATLFGSSRLGHYAAANQFLDGLAHRRQAEGLPALSVNWGAWEEMSALGNRREEAGRFGLKTMPARLAFKALSYLISEGVPQRMVGSVDWTILKAAIEIRGRRRFFENISSNWGADQHESLVESDWIERLESAASEDRQELVSSLVSREVRHVLGLLPEDNVDPDRGLFDLGMDSLMSVQLKSRLEKSVSCPLPATLTFTYPTVRALAGFLLDQVLKLSTNRPLDVSSTDKSRETGPEDQNLADLSDDEIKSMLSTELLSLTQDFRD